MKKTKVTITCDRCQKRMPDQKEREIEAWEDLRELDLCDECYSRPETFILVIDFKESH